MVVVLLKLVIFNFMGRYIGAKVKISRRYNDSFWGSNSKKTKRKNPNATRKIFKKRSEYGRQLLEKNKLHYIYNIRERQLYNFFCKVSSKKGNTGEILLQMLESRLDNVVYRLGIAPTRLAARQMVSHKHILVNDRVVNIASYIVKIGDLVSLSEKAKKSESLLARVNMKSYGKSTWLEWDQDRMLGRVLSLPERNEIPESINERHVVEFYSK